MSITAIRHLITPWNEQTLLQGTTDIAADVRSEANQQLIHSLRTALDDMQFDRVLVSPMLRAQQTAKALGIAPFETNNLVTEMSFGAYEGQPKPKMLKELGSAWINDPKSTVLAESLNELETRVSQLWNQHEANEQWLIISHGAFIRALHAYANHGSIQRMNQIEVQNGELVNIAA